MCAGLRVLPGLFCFMATGVDRSIDPADATSGARGSRWVLIAVLAGGLATIAALALHDGAPTGTSPNTGEQVATQFIVQPGPKARADEIAKRFDPASDSGWNTEILSASATAQLKQLGKTMTYPEHLSTEALKLFLSDEFTCTGLRPETGRVVYDDTLYSVRRWEPNSTAQSPIKFVGANGFLKALRELLADSTHEDGLSVAFKVFRIDASDASFTTQVLLEVSSRRGDSASQHNARWLCRWKQPLLIGDDPGDEPPRLDSVKLLGFEEVTLQAKRGRLFADCTESAMAHNENYRHQVLPGMNHWLTRIPRTSGVSIMANHGVAVGDVNGDGLEDVYVPDAGGLPNRLYLQNLDGTVTDASAEAGVDWKENSTSTLFIDLDNDGDQDLVVATNPGVLFAANDGSGRFRQRNLFPALDPFSLCSADYDLDGDLDLYVCGYWARHQDRKSLPVPVPYYDANNGGRSFLLRNDGDFRFSDMTEESGIDQNNTRYSFAAAWEDYDNDGDLDLYVANDFGRNNLYRNERSPGSSTPQFIDVAAEAGVEDAASGMSVTWGDYNRDGWMDLYVSNMFSSAGGRIAYQPQFAPGRGSLAQYAQRMARGNTLFLNRGDGRFDDATDEAAVTMGRWAWASKFADLNNDGWLDLVVTNGYFTSDNKDDL